MQQWMWPRGGCSPRRAMQEQPWARSAALWNHLEAVLGGLQPVRSSQDQFGRNGILWEGLHMKQRQRVTMEEQKR